MMSLFFRDSAELLQGMAILISIWITWRKGNARIYNDLGIYPGRLFGTQLILYLRLLLVCKYSEFSSTGLESGL